jgi:hypothetical protein
LPRKTQPVCANFEERNRIPTMLARRVNVWEIQNLDLQVFVLSMQTPVQLSWFLEPTAIRCFRALQTLNGVHKIAQYVNRCVGADNQELTAAVTEACANPSRFRVVQTDSNHAVFHNPRDCDGRPFSQAVQHPLSNRRRTQGSALHRRPIALMLFLFKSSERKSDGHTDTAGAVRPIGYLALA